MTGPNIWSMLYVRVFEIPADRSPVRAEELHSATNLSAAAVELFVDAVTGTLRNIRVVDETLGETVYQSNPNFIEELGE